MNVVNVDSLSPEKKKLLSLSNREVIRILDAAKRQLLQENPTPEYLKEKAPKSRIPDFAWEELTKIRDGTKELDEIRWKRYVLEYAKLEEKPLRLAEKDPKNIYAQLKQLDENNINGKFATFIIPILLEYLDNPKNVKPILLVGSPGSGKTYTAQILAEFMGLPRHYIYTPEVNSAHSLMGESRTWKARRRRRTFPRNNKNKTSISRFYFR